MSNSFERLKIVADNYPESYTIRMPNGELLALGDIAKLLDVAEAVNAIIQRERIGGYGHEGIPDLLAAYSHLEEDK